MVTEGKATEGSVDDETRRLTVLHRYGVLDQLAPDDLRAIARIAAYIAGTPIAMVNLVDDHRQYTAAAHGVSEDFGRVPIEDSICGHVVASRRGLNIPDLTGDERFAANPFVDGRKAEIRLYASQPLITPDGFAVGALCVVDPAARDALSPERMALLGDLADQVVSLMEMRMYANKLHAAVLTDHLTGLPNRRMLLDRLRVAVARAERGQGQPALLFCDLDGFKTVNDTFGHEIGDNVLVETGHRMCQTVRTHDTICRWGGDEFVILCDPLVMDQQAYVVSERLEEALSRPFKTSAGDVVIGASIGVTLWSIGDTPERMLARADRLMFERKRARKDPTRRDIAPVSHASQVSDIAEFGAQGPDA